MTNPKRNIRESDPSALKSAGTGRRRSILGVHAQDHPLALWLAHAAMLLGFLIVISPALSRDSASLGLLPPLGTVAWGLFFFLGGMFSALGLLTGRAKHEAAGMALLASAFAAAAIAQLSADRPSALEVIFLTALAGGTAHRAITLSRR